MTCLWLRNLATKRQWAGTQSMVMKQELDYSPKHFIIITLISDFSWMASGRLLKYLVCPQPAFNWSDDSFQLFS